VQCVTSANRMYCGLCFLLSSRFNDVSAPSVVYVGRCIGIRACSHDSVPYYREKIDDVAWITPVRKEELDDR